MRDLGLLALALAALAGCHDVEARGRALTGGDPARGRRAIERYGCGTCHTVPGVPTARGRVGPPLGGLAARMFVAGSKTNTPEHLMRWIRHPQQVEPGTVMPELGVTEQDARDIAAHLYALP